MTNCKDCEHSVFDEVWGEYKCKKKAIRIYEPCNQEDCEFYKKKVKEKRE